MSDQAAAGGDNASQQPQTPPTGATSAPTPQDGGQQQAAQQQPTPGTQAAPQAQPAQQPGQQPPADAQAQPFRAFKDQAELDEFVKDRVGRAKRSALNEEAKKQGFKSWAHMRAMVAAAGEDEDGDGEGDNTTPQDGGQDDGTQPSGAQTQQAQQANEAERLRLAIQVGAKKNLPAALVGRLQGATAEEMEADADALLALLQRPPGPGIPPAPSSDAQPVTFTQEQLRDAKFVREHADAIRQAAREGRIVRS